MTTMVKIGDAAEQIRACCEEWERQNHNPLQVKCNLSLVMRDKLRQARAIARIEVRKKRLIDVVRRACAVPLDSVEARRALEVFADTIELKGSFVGDVDIEMVEHRLAQKPRRHRPAKARPVPANVVQLRQPAPTQAATAVNPFQMLAEACRDQQRNLDRLAQVLGRRLDTLRKPSGGS